MTDRPEQPTFSVVVPTLGRAGPLEACLDALARLDDPPGGLEVVVVNDGGGPEIERMISRWDGGLATSVVSTASVGPAAARNAGAERAAGRFIAFTDDDCEPDRGWLRALAVALEQAPPGSAVGGRVVNGARRRCSVASQAVLDATHAHFNRDPEARLFFSSNNVAFPADGLRAVGGFDEALPFAEDRELCHRWVDSGRRFAYAPDAIVRHMRELSPLEFWRQHYGYGRGAWAYHRARSGAEPGLPPLEPGFYAELARQVSRPREHAGRASTVVLALVSQLANAAGFAGAALASRSRRGARHRD
jgi:GT2 family glycosyltransferase